MKILHVLTSPRAEGTPRLVLDWLSVAGPEQELLFLSPSGELKEAFEKTGVQQFYNSNFALKFVNALKIVKLVRDICLERQPDLVISWPMGFSQWVHSGAKVAGVKKLIVHAGNPPSAGLLKRYIFSYVSFWMGYILGSKVITCSQYIQREFASIPLLSRQQFHSVYNCCNISKFEMGQRHSASDLAIMVATLEDHKDHATLLKAWKLLEANGTGFRLQIVGSGSLKETLEALAVNLQLKRVEFLGTRSDIPYLLCQAKLFILSTTRQEGFGTVLIEALAAGCNVVASDVPACREVLQGGTYGILVKPQNEHALANAIVLAMANDISTEENERRKVYVKQFTPEIMMKNYLQIAGLTLSI